MLSDEERRLKEEALSGLTGGSFEEIVGLLLVVPVSILLYRFLYRHFIPKKAQWLATVMSAICAIFPLLMAMSVYTEYTKWYLTITVGLVLCGETLLFKTDHGLNDEEKFIEPMNRRIKPFLSNYRASMMLATCIAILAVDFNLFFPKRFAKCEEYGISLMDVGVGGFIFSSALVSSKPDYASSKRNTQSSLGANAPKTPSAIARWLKRMRSCLIVVIPLLILGLGRFTVVKAFGYQEHVSEYGMHWNFFMTLAGISLLVTALNIPLLYSGLVGIVVLAFYQYLLEGMGVAKWIIEAPRTDFFSQNREGILSCIGYLALYLFGQKIGSYILSASRTKRQWWRVVQYATAGGFLCWIAAAGMYYLVDMQASRRMVNMPYVLYTLACNLFIISAFITADLLSISTPNPLFDAVATKRNSQLVIFTIANLLTGATNVFYGTFNRPFSAAFVAMSVYMALVSIVALYWHSCYEYVASFFKSKPKEEKAAR